MCLYDASDIAITKELKLDIVKGEIPVYEKDGYKYTYITEDTIEIVGLEDNSVTSIIISETIDENTVVSVSREVFANSSLSDIVLPDTLITVKENAFLNCNNLSKVFYYGSQEDYEHIIIENGNENFTNASTVYEYGGTMIDGEITSIYYSNGNIYVDLGLEYCYKNSIATINLYDDYTENIVVTKAVSISAEDTEKEIIVPLVADDKAYNFEIIFSDALNTDIVYENVLDGAVFA